MMSFIMPFYICLKMAVLGTIFHMISPNGNWFVTINDIWTKKDDREQFLLEYVLQKLVDLEHYEIRKHPLSTLLIVSIRKRCKMQIRQGKRGMILVKNGIKIHIAVDVLGLPYASCVTPANVGD